LKMVVSSENLSVFNPIKKFQESKPHCKMFRKVCASRSCLCGLGFCI
jgi:hypothetical protein